MINPFVEQLAIGSFHNLEASFKFLIDPARYVFQAIWSEPTPSTEASIHGNRIMVPKMFNDHVKHRRSHDGLLASPTYLRKQLPGSCGSAAGLVNPNEPFGGIDPEVTRLCDTWTLCQIYSVTFSALPRFDNTRAF